LEWELGVQDVQFEGLSFSFGKIYHQNLSRIRTGSSHVVVH